MSDPNLDRRLFEGKLQSSIVYPEFFPLSPEERVVNLGCGVGPQVAIYRGHFREMLCVDTDGNRLRQLIYFMQEHEVSNFKVLEARVEATGLPDSSFDKALCIDIIEHLTDPMSLVWEVHRILKPGGRALVTVPVMHDRYTHTLRSLRGFFSRKKTKELPEGHPDRHNTNFSRREWMHLFQRSPLQLVSVRATTLFPPLHLYGMPRFWFTNAAIHAVDRWFSSTPGIRRLGQSWMCILEKT
ncbi:MAG: class I SAM-dependent methyltransferase [Patescibacteria group bacterium]